MCASRHGGAESRKGSAAYRFGQDTRRAEIRESLIDAALELLAERGRHGMDASTVAYRAGRDRVMVEQRFGSVQELLAVAWKERWPQQRDRLMGGLVDRGLAPTDRVRSAVTGFAELVRGRSPTATFARIVFLGRDLPAAPAADAAAWREQWITAVEEALTEAHEQGHRIDVATTTSLVVVLVYGLIARAVVMSPETGAGVEALDLVDRALAES